MIARGMGAQGMGVMDESGKGYKLAVIKWKGPRDVMYSVVRIVNNTYF